MIAQILFCCMHETVTYFQVVPNVSVWVQVKAKISNVDFKCKQGSFSLLSFHFTFGHSRYI